MLLQTPFDRAYRLLGLDGFVFILLDGRRQSFPSGGLEHFVVTQGVKFNQRVGKMNDATGRTIIVLKANNFGIRPVAMERQNVLDFRSTPAVDRLIVIAHHAQVSVLRRQRFDNSILALVSVLVFVNQQMIKPPRLFGSNVFVFLEQSLGQ